MQKIFAVWVDTFSGWEEGVKFDLFLFSVDPLQVQTAAAAGINGTIVDWEYKGKEERQKEADTEINQHTLKDLRAVRSATSKKVICRINRFSSETKKEIENAIDAGADEILLPMVANPDEVEAVLSCAANRLGVGILIETPQAVQWAPKLGAFPLSRVFIGLNDLAIARGVRNIFLPLIDGTVERIRPYFKAPFGWGGMTLPGLGEPIPCELLVYEMIRLDCQFTFLRRSFLKDVKGRDFSMEVARMKRWIETLAKSSPEIKAQKREELVERLTS